MHDLADARVAEDPGRLPPNSQGTVDENTAGATPIPAPHLDATLVRRSAEQAAAYIRDLIFGGYLRPGDRIHQDRVAQALGISRIPIREAIIVLEREGRIRTVPHRGSFVVALDEESIRDAAELVYLMQAFVARRAAERATDDVKAQLEEAQHQIDQNSDPIEMRRLMEQHRALIVTTGTSPRVAQWIRGTNDLVMDNFFVVIPGAMQHFKMRSAALTEAILRSDPDAAERCGQMFAHDVEDVIRYYKDQGLFGDT